MSTLAHPAQAPASSVPFGTTPNPQLTSDLGESDAAVTFVTRASRQDTPERWAAALKRAQDAGVRVYELGRGRYAVTSAHDAGKAYEVTLSYRKLASDMAHRNRQSTADLVHPNVPLAAHLDQNRPSNAVLDCTCPAAAGGDPVCLHRAIVREHLKPQPEPPAHGAYDKDAEALRWAQNDWERACRDLERYTAKIERGEVLNDREWSAFMHAQERELDASERIAELTVKAQVAA